ncbi:signal transduction histidine kinase [Variovorax sp. TBS-050B]|uniref:sensor histidine kinase n=1 Tax=Variovorax sp. TBS-050B TaxID=2940551 RepID=UPI002472FC59|nr:histidine kinase [Variovorax sp. TBS-050B]MDH6593633.1 signal transduction histidine kinase [Variovorax sp. TBS-050B]
MTQTGAPAAEPRFGARDLHDLLRHGLITAACCCVIAAVMVGTMNSPDGTWSRQLVYSLSIGLISWLLIDVGRLLLSGNDGSRWPSGARGVVLVAVSVTIGFFAGQAIGDAFSGRPILAFYKLGKARTVATITVTLAATAGMTYLFYSLGKSRHMQNQLDLARRNATEARLKLLETQLEPHMLFNTLANLRVLITTDPPRAVAMLDRLNSYLRMTLAGSRALAHPLAAEFDRLADYLELMSVRMGERLRYTLELPDDLRDAPVPPLLLQPLVENSIRHGLEPQVEGGEIAVRARRIDGELVIEVSDTGVGFDPAVPAAPRQEGGGFGLDQVRERLAAMYGEAGRIELAAAPAGGTRAVLHLPLQPSA